METCPTVGTRVQVKPGNRYFPCTGTVVRVWKKREIVNYDEWIEDDDLMPVYGGYLPEKEWAITVEVDKLPKDWAYGPNQMKFCPDVAELELMK